MYRPLNHSYSRCQRQSVEVSIREESGKESSKRPVVVRYSDEPVPVVIGDTTVYVTGGETNIG